MRVELFFKDLTQLRRILSFYKNSTNIRRVNIPCKASLRREYNLDFLQFFKDLKWHVMHMCHSHLGELLIQAVEVVRKEYPQFDLVPHFSIHYGLAVFSCTSARLTCSLNSVLW